MNFKEFYSHIYFSVDSHSQGLYKAKQGDTKSRGFYVTLIVNSKKTSVTNQSLYFYCLKPDGTKVFTEAEKDGDIFRLDLPNQVFSVAGELKCELTLRGSSGEQISTQTFTMRVEKSLQDGSIVSENERGAIDDALDLIATIEAMDIDIGELVILLNELGQNEVIRESQESVRESNETLRIALYDDLQSKLASGFFKGEKGDTGNGLEYTWNGTQLGVRVKGTTQYVYVDLKGEKGDPGSIDNLDITHIEDALGFIPISADDVQEGIILGEAPIEKGWLFKRVTMVDERNGGQGIDNGWVFNPVERSE